MFLSAVKRVAARITDGCFSFPEEKSFSSKVIPLASSLLEEIAANTISFLSPSMRIKAGLFFTSD